MKEPKKFEEPHHPEPHVEVAAPEKEDDLHSVLGDFMSHVYDVLDRHEHSPRPTDAGVRQSLGSRLKALVK